MERQSTAPVFAISGASSMISLKFGNRNNMHESLLLLLLEMLTLVDIRCMEHSLHLSYRHFIEAVAPPPPFKFTGQEMMAMMMIAMQNLMSVMRLERPLCLSSRWRLPRIVIYLTNPALPLLHQSCLPHRAVNIWCTEHSLHLSDRHFVKAVAPSLPSKFIGVTIHGQEDDDSDDSDTEFDVSDALGKSLALVKQVTIAHSHLPHWSGH
jgi:hypothetical protein